MADPKELIMQFQDITNGFLKQNEDSGVIKFLRTTVKSLDAVVKKIDAFLKTKNVDVGERLEQLSNTGKSSYTKASEVLASAKADVKSMGVKGFILNKASKVSSLLNDTFASDTETSGAPPNPTEGILAKLQAATASVASKLENLSSAVVAPKNTETVTSSKSSGLTDYQASLNESKERSDKRTAEITEEKEAVKRATDAKKKSKKDSWLGKMFGVVTKIAPFIVGGIGKVLLAGFPMAAKLTGMLFGKALTAVVPGLATAIAKGTSALMGKMAGGAAKGAWGLTKMAVTRGVPLLLGGAKALGAGLLTAAGGTALAIGGAVIGAGLLVYGGYKLYKYLNRNNLATDIFGQLTRLRLLMYGYNDAKKEHYHKLVELEMMMKDYIQIKDDRVSLVKFSSDFKEKIRELFEVAPNEKEKFAILNAWFAKRFLPAFKAFMDAFMPLGPNLYLDNIDKLSNDQVLMLASKLIPPTSIYNVTQVPTFDSPDISVDKQEVDDMLTSIRNLAKNGSKSGDGISPKAISQTVQKESGTIAAAAVAKSSIVTTTGVPPPALASRITPSGGSVLGANILGVKQTDTPNQEGEAPVPDTPGTPPVPQNTAAPSEATKLNIAPGGLQPGDKSLQGINIGPKGDKSRITGLHPKVFSLFTGMAKEFNTLTGKNVTLNESFRTFDDQMALRKKYPGKAAKPGNSIHEFGMALDINTPEANLLDEMGLMRKYGFTRPIGGETWHLEPAGVAINPQAAKTDPQAREQAINSSPGRGGGGFGASKSTPLGKRNQPLQKKLYAEGSATAVDMSSLTEKNDNTGIATGPIAPPTKPPSPPTTPSSTSSSASVSPLAVEPDKVAPKPTADTSTTSSLNRSGVNTTPASSLESAPAKNSNANLDPGAIGTQNLSPVQAIQKASNMVGMDPTTMTTFAKLESSLDPKAGASTSSAKGLFQITKPTWNSLLPKHGSQYNVPDNADIFDPFYNSVIGISYAKENAASVIPLGKKAGLKDEISLYLAHHFGPSGAKRLIEAYISNPDQPTQKAVSSSTYNANQAALSGKTVAQYVQSLSGKMNVAASTPNTAYKGMKGISDVADTSTTSKASVALPSAASASVVQTSYKATSTQSARPEMPGMSAVPSTPTPQRSVVSAPPMPQPSQTQNLNRSEEIMSNQLNVLIDIKKILEGAASGKPYQPSITPQPPSAQPPAPVMASSAPSPTPPPSAPVAPIMAPNNRVPSTAAVSMSRRQLS